MAEQLNGEYKVVFDKAELYGSIKNVPEDVKADMMMNLFDVLLTAQTEARSTKKVIGNDIEKFCEDYYANYNFKERLKRFPKDLYWITRYIFVLEMIFFLFEDRNVTILEAKSDIFPYIAGLFVGWLFLMTGDMIIRPLMFKKKNFKSNTFYGIYFAIYLLAIILTMIFTNDKISMSVPMVPVIIITFAYIALYLAGRSIWRYQKYGSIRKLHKEKSEYEFSLKGSFKLSNAEFAEALLERYNRKNKSLIRRGKEEITPQEFTEKIRKEVIIEEKEKKWVLLFYAGFIAVLVIWNGLSESITDTLIYAAILITIEVIGYCMWLRIVNFSINSRKKLLEEIDEMGISIVEYAKMYETQEGNIENKGNKIRMVNVDGNGNMDDERE